MGDAFCLGQILVKFPSSSTFSPQDVPQLAFLKRGNHQVHVLGSKHISFGDLSEIHSQFFGPLLGTVRGCSTCITKARFSCLDTLLIKLQAFVVTKTPTLSQLQACVFSQSEDVPRVLSPFLVLVLSFCQFGTTSPAFSLKYHTSNPTIPDWDHLKITNGFSHNSPYAALL